jgi:hypothetical protein
MSRSSVAVGAEVRVVKANDRQLEVEPAGPTPPPPRE